ncbi:ThiF family protein [Ancylostoma duodenale]|uniref:NEDD8-activating enzyme E1 catalytic subunit n=1 Tax=Ancylostoma duodenale TaxID=51022 RepID=A0A0C2F756_9BILA|nr:ThiF family protein [Ancylostoma duodenale]
MTALQKTRVLVVGAGGLGCELLKNLALSGFQNLDVIDMDTIDISNLNRQFLFRMSDVGKSKAEVAAAFVQSRVSGCTVTAHNCRIEDKPPSFYRQFSLVICGLDSIAARRWINGMLVFAFGAAPSIECWQCDLVITENGQVDTSTVIPLIDGGTEGFKGSARVIYPKMSACIDCTLDLFPPQVNFPLCTIAHTPRLPEHCVEYVKVLQWVEEAPFNGAALDADDPSHVEWVLNKALARAEKYGIKGVDRRLTQGVLKRIIPAVASTNAVIAASCALEAVKLATNTAKPIDNYLNFTDIEGVYCGVVQMERDPECATCSGGYVQVQCDSDDTLQVLIDKLVDKFQLKNPSLETATDKIYMINELIPELREKSVLNLERPLRELISADEDVLVADEVLSKSLSIRVTYTR